MHRSLFRTLIALRRTRRLGRKVALPLVAVALAFLSLVELAALLVVLESYATDAA